MFYSIRDLLPLMKWLTSVRKNLNFELALTDVAVSAADARNRNAQLCAKEYEAFEQAWNRFHEVSPIVNNDRYFDALLLPTCHQVILKKLTDTDPILHSCARLSGSFGNEAPYMCHVLGEIQNKFLTTVAAARPDYDRTGNAKKTRKCLHDVTEADIILHSSEEMWKTLKRFVRVGLDYGAGMQLECDWEQMELALKARLVDGKAMLLTALLDEGALQIYRYKQELFQDQANLFDKLNALIPQASTLPDAGAIIMDPALSDVGVVGTKLFPALDNLIFILLKQRKASLCPQQTLLEFAKAHLDDDVHWQHLEMRNSALVNITLVHVEALYELMEDVISTDVIGCLHYKFRVDIDTQLMDDVLLHLVPLAGDIFTLECIMRRFIIRYLRNPDAKNPAEPLYYHLPQMHWPKTIAVEDMVEADPHLLRIVNALCIGHVGSLQQALQQKIDDARGGHQQQLQQDATLPPASTTVGVDRSAVGPTVKKVKKPLVRPKGNIYSM